MMDFAVTNLYRTPDDKASKSTVNKLFIAVVLVVVTLSVVIPTIVVTTIIN
jgi:hypothetical protein